MSLKTSILVTVGLIVLAVGGGLAFLATQSPRQAEKVAEPLGYAMSVLCGIGVAAIWLPYLIRWQKAQKARTDQPVSVHAKRPERRGRSGR